MSAAATVTQKPRLDQNIEHALHAIGLLFEPGDVIEIRVLGHGGDGVRRGSIYAGYFNFEKEEALARAIRFADGRAEGLYVVLNKVNPQLLARANNRLKEGLKNTTADADILERRWLYIDVDPIRPAGISSTDAEHQAALDCAMRIRQFLAERGWPEPVYADSGNGGHLQYRLPKLALDRSGEHVKQCLQALAARFTDSAVSVDEKTFNAARICKLYGTLARKGDSMADRPHRRSCVLEAPECLVPIAVEALERLAAEAPAPSRISGQRPRQDPSAGASRFDIDRWLLKSVLEVIKGPEPYQGGRRWTLRECPFNPEHEKPVVLELSSGALVYRCLHRSCAENDWKALRTQIEPRYKVHITGPVADRLPSWDEKESNGSAQTNKTAHKSQAVETHPSPPTEAALPHGFSLDDDGVKRMVQIKDGDSMREEPQWICAPLEVVAHARTAENDEWGKLLRFRDPEGIPHQWVMPAAMLAKDTAEFRGKLLSMGLKISASKAAPEHLRQYLQMTEPSLYARTVERIGWFGETFVLPDENVASDGAEMVLLQPPREMRHCLRVAGSLDNWRRNVSRYCSGNSRLLFAISCAAAPPLLKFFREQSGGFHLVADTTVGKTTCLMVAGSFWGGGGQNGFVQSWLTTANGLENTAEWHNNVLLLLDELKLIDPEHASKVAYSLSNGQSKGRMDRNTRAHRRAEWQLLFLSTGELDLSSHIEAAQGRVYGGQEVRFCEIPARVDDANGVFESLHGFGSAKLFSEYLMAASRTHYGTACRAFLRHLVGMGHDPVREVVQQYRRRFVERYVPSTVAPEVARAGDRFALVAASGEFATDAGITAWEPGEAEAAAGSCFQAWRSQRGTDQHWDEEKAIKSLKASLIAHGNSRFQFYHPRPDVQRPQVDDAAKTVNRLGFRCTTAEGETEYQVLPNMLHDLCGTFSQELVLRALRRRGLLNGCAGYHLTAQRTLPEIGRTRCYAISSRIFEDDEPD